MDNLNTKLFVIWTLPLVFGCGSVCGDWGLLALVMDFKEIMLTSPPELSHWGEGGGGKTTHQLNGIF